MKAAFAGDVGEIGVDSDWKVRPLGRAEAEAPVSPPEPQPAPEPPSRYGEGRRLSLPAIAAILLAHAVLLWALVTFDVIHVTRKVREPTVVELLPDPIAPPPVAPEQPQPEIKPAEPELVVPAPVVAVPVVSAPPVAATSTPAPPQPDPVTAAAPAAAEGPPVAAPVVPPSPLGTREGNPAPDYPVEARRRKWQGTVRLRVVITVDGRVKDISVARSSGHDVLDKAALKAVAKWRFQPATQSGSPVEGVGYVPIPFVLKG